MIDVRKLSKQELIEMLVNPQDNLKQVIYRYLENNVGNIMNKDLLRLGDFMGINRDDLEKMDESLLTIMFMKQNEHKFKVKYDGSKITEIKHYLPDSEIVLVYEIENIVDVVYVDNNRIIQTYN